MKYSVIIFFVICTFVYSQEPEKKSFLELESEINLSEINIKQTMSSPVILEKKNTGLAILYSLLLPGMGELYAGDYSFGKYLTITDGVLWGTVAGFSIYGNWQRDNYQSFAEVYGKINLNNKDDDYYANIGNYLSIDDYNREMELNRDFDEMYNPETHYWSWDSKTERSKYRKMWVASTEAFNNTRFIIGALIVNRVISVINAVRCVSNYNKNLEQELSWNLYIGLEQPNMPSEVSVNFYTLF
ncbi:MAG: hypothetical protein JXA68_07830 [Ignavibacteriales bacterium]|nr:hypothetical protein [Ignavibacteriales bacterium]